VLSDSDVEEDMRHNADTWVGTPPARVPPNSYVIVVRFLVATIAGKPPEADELRKKGDALGWT
jgi:hypothetical protein